MPRTWICDTKTEWLSQQNIIRYCQRLGMPVTEVLFAIWFLFLNWKVVGENGSRCPVPSKLEWTQGLLQPWGFMKSLFEIFSIVLVASVCSSLGPPPCLPLKSSTICSRAGLWVLPGVSRSVPVLTFYWCENHFPKNSWGLFLSMTFIFLLDVAPYHPQPLSPGFLGVHLPASC